MLDGKTVLITGGTGSFGKKFIATIFNKYSPKKVIVYSRDELKQYEMQNLDPFKSHDNLMRYFIGDVRDLPRLTLAMEGVDVVVHAAALKQVPAAEFNPFEAVKTNIIGGQNVIDAARAGGVKRVIALSTDKAAAPIDLYGATKLASDKLFVAANNYRGAHDIKYSVVRYGNVIGSRGSVLPLFLKQRERGTITITDPRMNRFWITVEQGVNFVLFCLKHMVGGEIFVPKLPSMNIMDFANAIAPECKTEIIGIRPGEKIHEVMVTRDDSRKTLEYKNYYIIQPDFNFFVRRFKNNGGVPVSEGFEYMSGTNTWWLTIPEMKEVLKNL